MNGQQKFGSGGSHQSPGEQRGHSRGGARPTDHHGWVRELAEKVKDMQTVSADTIVTVAEKAGKELHKVGLKMNQIRRFLTEVREIEADIKKHKSFQPGHLDRVVLLRPKLAYAKGRDDRVGPLLEILDPAIKSVHDRVGFTNLLRLVEGIVAYHRAAGGTN